MKTMALIASLLAISLAGCGAVTWHNTRDPLRDFTADREHCEKTRGSEIGITHCLRRMGWDADPD